REVFSVGPPSPPHRANTGPSSQSRARPIHTEPTQVHTHRDDPGPYTQSQHRPIHTERASQSHPRPIHTEPTQAHTHRTNTGPYTHTHTHGTTPCANMRGSF